MTSSNKTCLILISMLMALSLLVPASDAAVRRTNTKRTIVSDFYSPAFKYGLPIPVKYTCDGDNISPPLVWRPLPPNAKSAAILCFDPDAPGGTFVHWLIYNIRPQINSLPAGVPDLAALPNGARQCLNDFNQFGYVGPCPPKGMHKYIFKLFVLSEEFWPDPRVSPRSFLNEIKNYLIDEYELIGTYEKEYQ